MGNRAVIHALESIANEPIRRPLFNDLFLTAPDIDAGVFKELAKSLPKTANHTTLYASSKDIALQASGKFHQYVRAGDTNDITVVPYVDTIDAAAVDTDLVGHFYYSDNRSILGDMFAVMDQYKRPGQRFGMRPNSRTSPTYWLFRP